MANLAKFKDTLLLGQFFPLKLIIMMPSSSFSESPSIEIPSETPPVRNLTSLFYVHWKSFLWYIFLHTSHFSLIILVPSPFLCLPWRWWCVTVRVCRSAGKLSDGREIYCCNSRPELTDWCHLAELYTANYGNLIF